jgi:hypothetical protein
MGLFHIQFQLFLGDKGIPAMVVAVQPFTAKPPITKRTDITVLKLVMQIKIRRNSIDEVTINYLNSD